jgi:quinol monooxygenase YgiN
MPQVIIHATIDFADQATRDEAIRQCAPVQWATRKEEPGCLEYCFAADPCVPNRINIHELWADHDSLHAHFAHHYYNQMRQIFGPLKPTGSWNRMFEVSKESTVYLEGGKIRERFFEDA